MGTTTPNNTNQKITKPITAYQELETCLTKAINAFNVREMLTNFGVPEDAEATLELELGDNPEPLVCCEIPTTTKKDHIPCGSLSLKSFQNLVLDDFINPALNILDLGKYLPDDDGKIASGEKEMKIVFSSNSPRCAINARLSSLCTCVRPSGRCCRFE